MRQRFFTLMLAIVAIATTASAQQTPEPELYAWADGTTLRFCYDTERSTHATTYDIAKNPNEPPVWAGEDSPITNVIFDAPMASYDGDLDLSCFFYNMKALNTVKLGSLENCHVTNIAGMFWNCTALTTVEGFETLTYYDGTDMSYLFAGCEALTAINLDGPSTTDVTNMSNMFSGCKSLESIDLSYFYTQNVTDMSYMFYQCEQLESIDFTGDFNTEKVTNMSYMFADCTELKSISLSSFNTENVTDMSYMFSSCQSLPSIDLSSFDTKNVTTMQGMFQNCSEMTILDLTSFTIESLTNTTGMFFSDKKLTTIYNDDDWTALEKINNSESMFGQCFQLVGASSFDEYHTDIAMANPTSGYFTQPVGPYAWLDNNILTFCYGDRRTIAQGTTTYRVPWNGDYPEWTGDEGNSDIVKAVFDPSFSNYDGDLNAMQMFYMMKELQNIEGLSNMAGCHLTNMSGMFWNCPKLNSVDGVNQLNTKDVTSMAQLFAGCEALTDIDLSGLNTQNVNSMNGMFDNCKQLMNVNLSGLSTQNVTDMSWMFYNCPRLTNLDLTGFDTRNVADMSYMFAGCENLKAIFCFDDWQKDGLTSENMFTNCTWLISNYTTTPMDDYDARFAHPYTAGNPGFFTAAIPIDEKNFPDEAFRSYLSQQDYGLDYMLTSEELAGVTEMGPHDLDIASLKGIEYFTALKVLNCEGNVLTELDLSHNTALEKLFCQNNNLTTLDISSILALKKAVKEGTCNAFDGQVNYAYGDDLYQLEVDKDVDLNLLPNIPVEDIADYIAGNLAAGTPFNEAAADYNNDGSVTIADVVAIIDETLKAERNQQLKQQLTQRLNVCRNQLSACKAKLESLDSNHQQTALWNQISNIDSYIFATAMLISSISWEDVPEENGIQECESMLAKIATDLADLNRKISLLETGDITPGGSVWD